LLDYFTPPRDARRADAGMLRACRSADDYASFYALLYDHIIDMLVADFFSRYVAAFV